MFILCDLPAFPLRQKANRAGNALTQKLLLLQYDSFPLVFNTAFFFWYCTISRNSCFSGNMMNRASICWSYPSTQMKHEMKQREPIIWQPFWQFYKNTVKWKAVAQFNINTITALYQKQSLEGRITYFENTWEVNEKLLNGMCSLVSNMWCTQNGYSAIYKTMLVSCNTMFAWDKAYL